MTTAMATASRTSKAKATPRPVPDVQPLQPRDDAYWTRRNAREEKDQLRAIHDALRPQPKASAQALMNGMELNGVSVGIAIGTTIRGSGQSGKLIGATGNHVVIRTDDGRIGTILAESIASIGDESAGDHTGPNDSWETLVTLVEAFSWLDVLPRSVDVSNSRDALAQQIGELCDALWPANVRGGE
jgi:hypothetical protein